MRNMMDDNGGAARGKTSGGAQADKRAPVLVLGVGNILLRDEGLGVRAAEALGRMALPEGVEVVDGATAGADLIDIISEREKVVVIDAVQAQVAPGTVMRFTGEDFAAREVVEMSLHQVGFVEALHMAGLLGCAPGEVVVYGVRPEVVEWGLELSNAVKDAVDRVVGLVASELGKTGE